MAEMKANMLLTVASVVMTLSAPHLFSKNFELPVIVLCCFCLVTVLLAVYAVMPNAPLQKKGSPPDVASPMFNILSFADFCRMDYEDFEAEMENVMNDPSRSYQVQVLEIYTLGCYLARRKYRYLRLAYLTFITGIISAGLLLGWHSGIG